MAGLVNTIAQLMLEKGRAQAQGALGSGQAWAQGIQNIGQDIAAIPRTIQANQDDAIRRQLAQQQVTAGAQQASDLKALDTAFQQPGGRDAVIGALPGHLRPSVTESLNRADESGAKAKEATLAAENATTGYVNDLAEGIKAHGYAPEAAQIALAHAKSIFSGNPSMLQQVGQIEQAIQTNPSPDAVKSIVDPILATRDAKEKPIVLPATPRGGAPAQLVKPTAGTVVASGTAAPAAPPTPTELALQAAGGDPVKAMALTQGPQMAARDETARHNLIMEGIQKMQVGREAAANTETARHNKAMEAAGNPLAALSGGAGSPANAPQAQAGAPANPTGDAVLATLPAPVASQVKALAEGRMAFPAGFALKSPYWQSMISLVSQYDPSFDAVNYNARNKTRADFTSGKSAGTINALNTVAQHLDRLSTSAEALNNSWSPAYNSVANFLSRQSGSKVVTNFETDKKAVVDELTRAWRQAGGSEGDIKSWSQVLDASNSPEQLHSAIGEMGHLLEGKLSAMQNQYEQGMGHAADIPIVTPQARNTLDKIEQRASGQGAPSSAGSKTLSVDQVKQMSERSGKTYAEAKAYAESQGYIVK